jgi:6-phosphogluconolactonase
MRLTVCQDAEAVARNVADELARRARLRRARRARIHMALAGGTSPRRVYELLGRMDEDWDHVDLWLGDERCVSDGDPDSNAQMVRETLFGQRLSRPPRLHRAQSPERPDDAAWLYGTAICAQVPEGIFDVVMLGMGQDGHTASLFPGHPALAAGVAPCVAVRGAPRPPAERITLTLPLLRRARYTVMVVAGAEKRETLARVLAGDTSLPAALLLDGIDELVTDRVTAGEGE